MSVSDSHTETERRELRALLWFFWVGILLATGGESVLVFMLETSASEMAGNIHAFVVGFLAALMWFAVALVYRRKIGGGGFATAIFCWMLAKGSAILSFVMYFLAPGWTYTSLTLAGFVVIMLILRPSKFTTS